ncbi:GNAT family N-acetyltransferase [Nocardia sp. CDC159]|uniref:GNAT family N-acetyltransferase n=1 Tax=Nocardia pulmonis TaxID=2951408 RepID=A0A9X2E8L5_9NOCA|nr:MULTISPECIES: GNAT family N-acetyltransferase [Nocardia]MCM6773473.1 GNAT family N-acetyltransferase [Nocardia pulmonis]MCM6786360.1 GNAT family N-acetyltransferase [Nocardia sp. CDC159]
MPRRTARGSIGRVRVRRLGDDEWRAARDVRLDTLATSPPGTFAQTFAEASQWDERRWRQWYATRTMFVVESEQRGIGCAGVLFEPTGPLLVSVWVSPAARGTGASDLLLDSIVDWVRARGHHHLRLWVLDGNTPAEKLYRRMGFLPTGRQQVTSAHSPDLENEMVRVLR